MAELVTTVEELEALPEETAVRDADGYILELVEYDGGENRRWRAPGSLEFYQHAEIGLPAVVLFRPDRPTLLTLFTEEQVEEAARKAYPEVAAALLDALGIQVVEGL